MVIPDKLYFKIGEVSALLQVQPYVLRYWETEFDVLKPNKAPSRHRLYKREDVELLLDIKRLLYAEGHTIEGARKKLKYRNTTTNETSPDTRQREMLLKIKNELISLRDIIS